jgi:hypothetical protein
LTASNPPRERSPRPASPCVLAVEGFRSWLVAQPNTGLAPPERGPSKGGSSCCRPRSPGDHRPTPRPGNRRHRLARVDRMMGTGPPDPLYSAAALRLTLVGA